MTRSALILAGHGSHLSPNTASIVWETVDVLRRIGAADEVTAAFWKEMPSFATVFDGLLAQDITVVPLFTAQGYFTQTVIPAEMQIPESQLGLDPRTAHDRKKGLATRTNLKRINLADYRPDATHPSRPKSPGDTDTSIKRISMSAPNEPAARAPHESPTIRLARTLGEHRRISEIVRRRVDDAIRVSGAPRDQIGVAVIGHSTRRNPDSRKATEAQTMLLRASTPVREVAAVYLDDSPSIPDVYAIISAPVIIAVPYFLAAGSHTTFDVPAELGLETGATQGEVNGRLVIYTPPLGSIEEMVDMALDLAHEAGAPLNEPRIGTEWDCFPRAGHDQSERLWAGAPAQFGQLYITRGAVRHIDDVHNNRVQVFDRPSALRAHLRGDPFRPLATAADLPGGWHISIDSAEQLHAVIETAYPGVLGTSSAARRRGVGPDAWSALIGRQTGRYKALEDSSLAERAEIVRRVCHHCVLTPAWIGAKDGALLCREPCNVWLSAAISGEDLPT